MLMNTLGVLEFYTFKNNVTTVKKCSVPCFIITDFFARRVTVVYPHTHTYSLDPSSISVFTFLQRQCLHGTLMKKVG